MNQLALVFATFGYVGYFPIAPGTAGSLAALVLFALVRWLGMPAFEIATIVVVFVGGLWAANATEHVLGRKDPGAIVIDEVLGMLMTLALLPVSTLGIFVGFVLFRLFDVVKPFPAGRMEHLKGGPGVMLDDVVAGIYAHISLRLLALLVPSWLMA
ncbi:MAG: phosphatidylglycerophosphatase A [Acidobacteriota bacterium]|nr:phosphatidylglycerophosphatase A [Acidobacteriota bacterium]